jgi:alkanesulfonate monooxygenase SsuD/methylene tetrahydromethanopterin reductase-like flavin-dependent oxidoreductase (luciferase family)
MIGSNGPRVLGLTLPHVDAWNTWYSDIGNSAEGFAALNARISAAAAEAGRDPAEVARSACLYVVFDRSAPERPIEPDAPPVEPERAAAAIAELGQAGADEVILVVSPITERSIRALGELVFSGS